MHRYAYFWHLPKTLYLKTIILVKKSLFRKINFYLENINFYFIFESLNTKCLTIRIHGPSTHF